MSLTLNETHNPSLQSWVESANQPGHDFPIQNLPFGVFQANGRVACGIAIGDMILEPAACANAFQGVGKEAAYACSEPNLNWLMSLGNQAASALRKQVSALLAVGNTEGEILLTPALHRMDDCELKAPVAIAGFTDFFASVHHATNAGRLFRPDNPLLPNYKYVPVAYNGRANSVRVSGVPVQRPNGQLKSPDQESPVFGPCKRLDFEVELGAYVGLPSSPGQPLQVCEAWDHLFGFCLLNDWSARDIQTWEYQPLGPFLAKTFATSVSPWVVTAEALLPFRTSALHRPEGDPAPLPHLNEQVDQEFGGLNVSLEAYLQTSTMKNAGTAPAKLSQSNASALYWTFAQMLAHHTSNGSAIDTGDLMGSGTVSGAEPGAVGSLLEITRGGTEPLQLTPQESRTWLEDGDSVSLHGFCEQEGFKRIGFGKCTASIVAAPTLKPN